MFLLFLPCFVFVSGALAQTSDVKRQIEEAQLEFDNGNYSAAIEHGNKAVAEGKQDPLYTLAGLDVIASSQIALQAYDQAETSLNEALRISSEKDANPLDKAQIFLRFAWLRKSQHKFAEALDYSKKALALVPTDRHIAAEYYLILGRIMFASGYDISAIIWLEKAESLLEAEKTTSPAKLDTYRFLALAWWAKLNYQKALKYAERSASEAADTRYKYKYRQFLFDLSTILSETGQKAATFHTLNKGLKLALVDNNTYQARIFLTSLLLNYLDDGEVSKASTFLQQLEELDRDNQFSFEVLLGKAIILALNGQDEKSEELFARLKKMENSSEFILPGWQLKIAQKKEDWNRLVKLNKEYLDLTIKSNFRDELPSIFFNFAQGYFHLNQISLCLEYLHKSLALVEEIRQSGNTELSLGLLETYHKAYRLLTQIELERPQEAFATADFLKARLLKDRINGAAASGQSLITPETKKRLEDLSIKYINDPSRAADIEKNERSIANTVSELNLAKPDLSELDKFPELNDTAVISYFFTLDKRLLAFVWEKGKPLRVSFLPSSEDEIQTEAENIQQKIKDRVFFKRDGKDLFEKLLKPLSLSAKHLIIVPDKFLWKIPFQALSSDGEKYLIEEKVISYAPSVSILLDQLRNPKPNRSTLQAFANPIYDNRYLSHVNNEATSVAALYNSKPSLNSTIDDFRRLSDKADILHFSMHAQVDNEWPLESFLGFRGTGKNSGRLTVEDILHSKLKKGSLVFLASCDTNNVLSGEGLVSLAWGIMGAGATTVISAQWEANDELTGVFTKAFYKYYKQGVPSAEALQRASLEMIKNKSNNMHEPYYWADFTLNGDFR